MKRREFLRDAALALPSAALLTNCVPLLYAFPYDIPAGLQLYTVRQQLAKDLTGTLKQVAQIGYKQVEFFTFRNKTAAEWKQILSQVGLTITSAHYQTPQIKTDWQKHIDYAGQLGLKYMVLAFLQPRERTSLDDYKNLVGVLNRAGEQTQKSGIQFCYHNHNFEFANYGGTTGFDVLIGQTDPKLVKLEMDCFWVVHAGHDPVEIMKKYPGRIPLLHIKDRRPGVPVTTELNDAAIRHIFAPVGKGTIDWKRVFASAKEGGLEHYFVEQDFTEGSPFDAIKTSYEYLQSLTV